MALKIWYEGMKFRFKPSDFELGSDLKVDEKFWPSPDVAANTANRLLMEYEKTLPRVYGRTKGNNMPWYRDGSGEKYTALLYAIEPIEGKE